MFEHLKWKMVERPLLAINNSYVDAFPFLVLFAILFIAGVAFKSRLRARIRPWVQVVSFIFFIFVVHRCFCALRGWFTGIQEIGRNDLNVFQGMFVFVPILAFTIMSGKIFCGWACPLGTVQEIFFRFGFLKRFLTNLSQRAKQVKILFSIVILTASFAALLKLKPKTFFFAEDIAAFWAIAAVILSMFYFFNPENDAKIKKIKIFLLAVLAAIIIAGIFITDPWCALFGNELDYSSLIAFFAIVAAAGLISMPWCRYACPLGAFLGLFVKFSSVKVQRNNNMKLTPEGRRNICYTEALLEDYIDESACLYCARCVDCGAAKIEDKSESN